MFCFGSVLFLAAITASAMYFGRKYSSRFTKDFSDNLATSSQVMLALSSFLLVICYNIAENRFDQRKTLVIQESNDIGTLYLRTDLLPPKQSIEAKQLLKDYLQTRIKVRTIEELNESMEKTKVLHTRLWQNAIEASKKMDTAVYGSIYIQALNAVIDIHAERYNRVLRFRTPISMIYALFFSTAFSMSLLAFSFGLKGSKNLIAIIGPILLFSIILILILDLDNTKQRFFHIGQDPYLDVIESTK